VVYLANPMIIDRGASPLAASSYIFPCLYSVYHRKGNICIAIATNIQIFALKLQYFNFFAFINVQGRTHRQKNQMQMGY